MPALLVGTAILTGTDLRLFDEGTFDEGVFDVFAEPLPPPSGEAIVTPAAVRRYDEGPYDEGTYDDVSSSVPLMGTAVEIRS